MRYNCSLRLSWPLRAVVWLVLATQVLIPYQGLIYAATSLNSSAAASPPSLPAPVLTPANVVVNRTVPKGQPFAPDLRFSTMPTDAEIFRAHVFSEPIISMGTNKASANENQDLAEALFSYHYRSDADDASVVENFLQTHPNSPRYISLMANVASHFHKTSQFTKAMEAWKEVWTAGKDVTDSQGQRVVDESVGNWASFMVTLGRKNDLEALLKELDGRPLHGSAAVKISEARYALQQMQFRPQKTFKCGPFSLYRIRAALNLPAFDPAIDDQLATTNGTTLVQNLELAKKMGMQYQMARRNPGAAIPLPAMAHWKLGHFSAITKFENGRYLIEDPTFTHAWISPQAMDAEASGYFLIPAGPLPAGWSTATVQEGETIWGRSLPMATDYNLPPCPPKSGGYADGGGATTPCKGMAQYSIYTRTIGLNIADLPVGYTPPRGPAVEFRLTYNELEINQPAVFPFGNLGPQWNYDWLAYVADDTSQPSADVKVINGESAVTYTGFNSTSQTYAVTPYGQTTLIKLSGSSYERLHSDGSKEFYSFPETDTNTLRRVFMTSQVDPAGNAINFNYDSSNRLVSVQDAIGQVTTLSYGLSGDPLKITKVTDPFGRYATLQYNSSGQLTNITDEIGISSQFSYGSASEADFINALTTPYGTTTFTNGNSVFTYGIGHTLFSRWIEATDPMGAKERVEFTPLVGPDAILPTLVPAGMNTQYINSWLEFRSTYAWDKKAMQTNPRDYTKAKQYVWSLAAGNYYLVSGTLQTLIMPLENPVWYNYPGQPDGRSEGTINKPSAIGRVLDDGSTQLQQFQYNSVGKTTKAVDPLGRTTYFTYATDNIDLLTASQLAAGATNLLGQFTYNSQHLPLTMVDAAGQTNRFGYNTNGQMVAATNALNQVATLAYNTNGYLTNIVGALPGATASFSYDGYGRVRTVTDSEGYTVTYDYDALDRPTKVMHPDGTYEQLVYKNLDPVMSRDRLGRWTGSIYNAQRQLTAVADALGRITSFERCSCGALESITDPLGRTTAFVRDLQKRVTAKIYPDGTQLAYTYENTTSRLKAQTDAKNQQTVYSYYNDNNLKQVSYNNAVIATPSVSFTYDTNYNRLLAMVDGTGTNSYSYYAVTNGQLGAGRLSSVSNSFVGSLVAYNYDALGRVTNRAINNVSEQLTYDALGRVTIITNALGSFTNVYVRATGMIATNFYPNGQQTVFSYYGTNNDERLSEIWNQKSGGTTLSKFDYAYNPEGEITNWTEQADNNTPTVQVEEYDPVNQLLGATVHSNTIAGSILKQFIYQYDKAGNRTSEQIDSGVSQSSYNNLNQLNSRTGSTGTLRFKGSLNETGTVLVAGSPAKISAYTNFTSYANVSQGTNVIPIIASDYSGHSSTNKYQVVVTNNSVAKTITYDLNGNETAVVTSTSTNTYQWDAANRLVSITGPTNQSLFTYDGMGRRVQIVELTNGVAMSTNKFLWDMAELCEQRSNTGAVIKRFFDGGEQIAGLSYYFTFDHLGSVREMVDSLGGVQARYDYDPYGRNTKTSGSLDADFRFTGFYYHSISGFCFTLFRSYDSDLGRWLSRDPIEERDGLNLYEYVGDNPSNLIDPFGLSECDQLKNDIQGRQVVRSKLNDMFANWKSGQGWGNYGLTPLANAAGGRSKDVNKMSNYAQDALNKIESDSIINDMQAAQLAMIGGVGYYTFGLHGLLHGTSAQEQWWMTRIAIEQFRNQMFLNKLKDIYKSQCN